MKDSWKFIRLHKINKNWKIRIGKWEMNIRLMLDELKHDVLHIFQPRALSFSDELSILEQRLSYKFKDKSILDESRRHSSYVNEQAIPGMRDNERFEFLGDAVLNLSIGHLLMARYPEMDEGDLSKTRASLVNEFQLACLAKSLNLGAYLRLGKGEIQTEGREKNSILADAFEAIIAAVYLDGGFDAAFRFVEIHFSDLIDTVNTPASHYDYKSHLQEIAQLFYKVTPVYKVIQEIGPDHDKTFIAKIKISEFCTKGVGKSKKMAEQDAAKKAIEILKLEEKEYGGF